MAARHLAQAHGQGQQLAGWQVLLAELDQVDAALDGLLDYVLQGCFAEALAVGDQAEGGEAQPPDARYGSRSAQRTTPSSGLLAEA